MSILSYSEFQKHVSALPLGKKLPDAIYLHQSALLNTDASLADFIANLAITFHIDHSDWNLLKLSRRSFKVTFLLYPDFDDYAYPKLQHSLTIDIQKLSIRKANYADSANPPILHRKETFVATDYPSYQLFSNITKEGELAGLYEKARSIGFKNQWEKLIKSKGYSLDSAGRLHKASSAGYSSESTNKVIEVARHKTAIDRNQLSSPMQILARHGYFDGSLSVLDYGCGKGDDVRELEAHGLDVAGWDPVHRPQEKITKKDIVNLGFVLNVIEEIKERNETLKKAFSHAKQLLIASVMVAGESLINQYKPYKDGIITSRNTFQRYYSQSEFKAYLEDVLNESAIAVGQGIFIIFRDKLEEQKFLFERQQSRRNWRQLTQREARAQTKRVTKELIDSNKELFADFWETVLELGRIPGNNEFEFSEQIRSLAGSHRKAFDALKDYYGEDSFTTAEEARKNDLLVYFALGQFARRKPYRTMPEELKLDIKHFFGTYTDAQDQSTKRLFSVGNPTIIETKSNEAFQQFQIGEFNSGHSWVIPKTLLNDLPPELRIYVGCACQLYGDLDEIDLIKIHFTSGKVSLMKYDDFTKDEPLLVQRIKIKLRELDFDVFDYGERYISGPLSDKNIYSYNHL